MRTTELFEALAKGFDLVGRLPESGVFKKKFRPATLLEDDLREGAARARAATLATVGPSDNPVIDDGVLQASGASASYKVRSMVHLRFGL